MLEALLYSVAFLCGIAIGAAIHRSGRNLDADRQSWETYDRENLMEEIDKLPRKTIGKNDWVAKVYRPKNEQWIKYEDVKKIIKSE